MSGAESKLIGGAIAPPQPFPAGEAVCRETIEGYRHDWLWLLRVLSRIAASVVTSRRSGGLKCGGCMGD